MKPGRKPLPANVRALKGGRPNRVQASEPVPSQGVVRCPAWLPKPAKAVWRRLAPDLIRAKVLTPWDVDLFATWCATVALNQAAIRGCFAPDGKAEPLVPGDRGMVKNPSAQILRDSSSTLMSLSGLFGLTPSDRARLKLEPPKGRDGDQGAQYLSQ